MTTGYFASPLGADCGSLWGHNSVSGNEHGTPKDTKHQHQNENTKKPPIVAEWKFFPPSGLVIHEIQANRKPCISYELQYRPGQIEFVV